MPRSSCTVGFKFKILIYCELDMERRPSSKHQADHVAHEVARACQGPCKVEQPIAQQAQVSDVLRVLLSWLCTDAKDDMGLLCKLLCCSTTTASLVHDTCAGQMTLHMEPPNTGRRPMPTELVFWLAKHVRLLGQLHIICSPYHSSRDVEEFAAAALRAVAGVPSMCPAVTSRLHLNHPALPIKLAEAAAQLALLLQEVGSSSQSDGQASAAQPAQPAGGGMLPLLELQLMCALDGTLLPTIPACCGHLTKLQLHAFNTQFLAPTAAPIQRNLLCLSSLRDLRELQINIGSMQWEGNVRFLSSLTHLTKLEVPEVNHAGVQHLPTSLMCLELLGMPYGHLPDLRRLSSLTRLNTNDVQYPQLLPVQLQELGVSWIDWSDEILQLQQLQSLQMDVYEDDTPDLAPLTAWTHLTALRLRTHCYDRWTRDLSALCEQLPKFPLVLLQLQGDRLTTADIEHLGRCTQLTLLDLFDVHVGLGVGAFAEQLQKLQGLECLTLTKVRYSPHPQLPVEVQPLVDVIKHLCGKRLREVGLTKVVLSGEQQSVLKELLGSKLCYKEGQLRANASDSESMSDGEVNQILDMLGFGGGDSDENDFDGDGFDGA